MIETKPDWVISRQRAWGVPIAVFVRENGDGSVEILQDERVNARIAEAFEREGADAWYAEGARERFLGGLANEDWQKVDDILDVWFNSGSTHAFVLEDPKHFPALAGIRRKKDGGPDTVMYLEGSDQHRGWFHSSLIESCGTRGAAPFDVVLTHGFVLDENGRKMSKSLGNTVAPQDVIKASGADILRMWVCASDYADDLRIGPEILKTTVETYRKLRNTIRWMLGNLVHFREGDRVAYADMPGLEKYILHRLAELDEQRAQELRGVRLQAHLRGPQPVHDGRPLGVLFRHPQGRALLRADLLGHPQGLPHGDRSGVPRDRDLARPDALLHGGGSVAVARIRGRWLGASRDPFRRSRRPGATRRWRGFGATSGGCAVSSPARWRSSAPTSGSARASRPRLRSTSPIRPCWIPSRPNSPAIVARSAWRRSPSRRARPSRRGGAGGRFPARRRAGRRSRVPPGRGAKCARSWKILPEVGSDPDYPDVTPRDARALREWDAAHAAAE